MNNLAPFESPQVKEIVRLYALGQNPRDEEYIQTSTIDQNLLRKEILSNAYFSKELAFVPGWILLENAS
jgi:hypothetical protein